MSLATSYPGLYILETPKLSHTIVPAPTSVTVFVGYSHPFKTASTNWNKPVELFSFTDYENNFGGFFTSNAFATQNNFGDLAHAVYQFFENGGSDAFVVALKTEGVQNGVG